MMVMLNHQVEERRQLQLMKNLIQKTQKIMKMTKNSNKNSNTLQKWQNNLNNRIYLYNNRRKKKNVAVIKS